MDATLTEKEHAMVTDGQHLEMANIIKDETAAQAREHALSPTQYSKLEKRVVLKQDLTIVLLLCGCYFFAYLDRGAIGNARVMGFQKDMHLSDSQFYNCLMMFFVGYMVFELPAALSLRVVHPPYVYGASVIMFGVFAVCMASARSYAPVMILRLLIGLAEAFVQTGFVFISLWYLPHELTTRCAFYFGATPIAGAFSGLIAYGVQKNLNGSLGKTSWEWFYIIEGVLTISWGLIVLVLLPKLPETVAKRGSWLFRKEEEHAVVLSRTIRARNAPDAKPQLFQVWWALKDPKTWLGALALAAPCLNVAAFGAFLPTFIKEFGFSSLRTQLMSMIPYAFATFSLPLMGMLADKWQKRAIPLLICLAVALIGFIILLTCLDKAALLVGCCFVAAGSYPALVIAVSWIMNSHAGYTKRSTAWAVGQVFIQCYSIISTQVYTDAPRYFKGHGVLLGLNAVGIVAAVLMMLMMKRENAKRDKVAQEYARQGLEDPQNGKSYEELCDGHPRFRYAL